MRFEQILVLIAIVRGASGFYEPKHDLDGAESFNPSHFE